MKKKLSFTAGATRLCATLKTLGYRTAVISGSFLPVAQHVQRLLELNYAFANVLEVDESSGQFTGLIGGPVITPQRKRNLWRRWLMSRVVKCSRRWLLATVSTTYLCWRWRVLALPFLQNLQSMLRLALTIQT